MTDRAILHDQILNSGGAERVLFELARALDAPIYTMWADEQYIPDDVTVHELAGPVGQRLVDTHFLAEDIYQMLEWQHVKELYQYDTIVQNKTNPYWFVPHADSQTVIRYCHSTPRGLYDQFKRRGGSLLGDALSTAQRLLYEQTTEYADRWLCNSEIVQRRLELYWGVDASVIYPPVETTAVDPTDEAKDYLFHVGRLAVNKRIPLLKRLAAAINAEIVVAGDGPHRDELTTDQPENLTYLGHVDEPTKWKWMRRAKATLFVAENEDFGIVPIESFAAGTPVVGVDEGYTQHQIRPGENGYLTNPTVAGLADAIDTLQHRGVAWDSDELAAFADQFSTERFRTRIAHVVEQVEQQAQIEPQHSRPVAIHESD